MASKRSVKRWVSEVDDDGDIRVSGFDIKKNKVVEFTFFDRDTVNGKTTEAQVLVQPDTAMKPFSVVIFDAETNEPRVEFVK